MVSDQLAAQLPQDQVFDAQPVPHGGKHFGLVLSNPHQLVDARLGLDDLAGDVVDDERVQVLTPPCGLRLGARVIPGNHRRQWLAAGIERHAGLTHAGD